MYILTLSGPLIQWPRQANLFLEGKTFHLSTNYNLRNKKKRMNK